MYVTCKYLIDGTQSVILSVFLVFYLAGVETGVPRFIDYSFYLRICFSVLSQTIYDLSPTVVFL